MRIELMVNGRQVSADVEAEDLLLDVLRRPGDCMSVREGCGVGVCGACTAIVDGVALSTCLELAARHDGANVLTVEGLAHDDAVAEAFVAEGAMQCGYCTPGFVLMARALLASTPQPGAADVEACLAANVCRCGAYAELERAISTAAATAERSAVVAPSDVTVSAGDVRLAARRRGTGEPVVLLHSLAMAGSMWDDPADRLARQFEVWSYDARGHGATVGGGEAFSIDDMADDLAALLDGAGLERVSLVGLSMGGSTALVFAARHPARVERLVLADTTACYGPTRVADWEARAQKAVASPREDQLAFQLERWFSPAFLAEHPAEARRQTDIFLATDSRGHAAACRALGQLDAVGSLPGITAQTLVLVGEHDTATPPAMAEQIAASIPRATLHVMPETRHLSLIERPEAWDRIEAFLVGEADSSRR
jgi:3-oxoadipate enol-lactonase